MRFVSRKRCRSYPRVRLLLGPSLLSSGCSNHPRVSSFHASCSRCILHIEVTQACKLSTMREGAGNSEGRQPWQSHPRLRQSHRNQISWATCRRALCRKAGPEICRTVGSDSEAATTPRAWSCYSINLLSLDSVSSSPFPQIKLCPVEM